MSDPPLFSSLIVSRTPVPWGPLRRAAAIAAAFSLHLTAASVLILSPFICLEMMQPPKALTMEPPLRIFQPFFHGRPGRGDRRLVAPIRRGGRRSGPETATEPRKPETVRPPRPPVQPVSIPLEPPQPGAPSGPGSPDGSGDSPTGASGGCAGSGCDGSGPGDGAGPGEGEGGPDGPLFEWDSRVTQPALIPSSRALPKYPDLARRAGVQGSVILMITIGPDGTVGEVQVIRAPDQRWGFDLAAIEAVKRWRYRPALMSGRPVSVYAQVMVEFSLSR